jgi:Transcription elongation factor
MEHKKPAITLSSLDMDRLEALMEKLPANFPGFAALEAELDRADVLDPQEMPANVVTMNSTVRLPCWKAVRIRR